jgi:hypothetical protein
MAFQNNRRKYFDTEMTNRTMHPAVAFLRDSLANGALTVAELEGKARAAGLLSGRKRIQHSKPFKKAKKLLGIKSIRDGFGRGGNWAWFMPPKAAPERRPVLNACRDTNEEISFTGALPDKTVASSESGSVVQQWLEAIQRLDYLRCPAAVPPIRWHLFLGDCHSFLNSSQNWAERAAALGWNALALFGCHSARPLEHLGSAGLLWAINGGKIVELHRDWAVIERAPDRSRRIHYRRSQHKANIALPWNAARDAQSDRR